MEKVLLNKESLMLRRIGAFIIDHILITIIAMIPFMMNFNRLSEDTNYLFELFPIMMLIGVAGYLCKDTFSGRSIGKLLFGIYVREYEDTDETPKLYKLILRNIPVLIWFVEFIVMLIDKEGRRLGDKIAKTQVIGYQNKIVLRIVITAVLAFSLFVSSLFIGIIQIIKNDASYKAAVQYIEKQNEISTAVGEIQGFGSFPMGSINYNNGYGTADLSIKVNGKKKSIDVEIYLEKSPGSDWVVKDMKY
ncbi:MAG TPA: cytochrome c oxidase assembly factor Coa1 family protein [Clostridia bacterium]